MSDIIALLTNKELMDSLSIGLVGLALLGLQKIFVILYNYFQNILFSYRNFTISGIWLANFLSHIKDKRNLELVRISHDQENIGLYMEQYSNLRNRIYKFEGSGVFRASKMSAVYYPLEKSEITHGVLALRTISTQAGEVALTGKYTEFETTENGETLRNVDYTLKRIKLPLVKRIWMKFRIPCFRDYAELNAYLSENKLV